MQKCQEDLHQLEWQVESEIVARKNMYTSNILDVETYNIAEECAELGYLCVLESAMLQHKSKGYLSPVSEKQRERDG